nr:acetylxylan esterase [Lactococcus cremoris]
MAHFYHLWFKAIDGAKIHAQLIVPKNLNKKYPAIIQFHGYHCDSGDWVDKIGIVAEGNVVLALDCRGQGGLSQDNTETSGMTLKGLIVRGIDEGYGNLYYVRQFMDLMSATKILANFDFVDETNISAQGASQGGGLAIACAALSPLIKKVTATYPFLSDYRKAYELGAEESAFEELPYWFQFKDPLHQKEDWFFNQLEYIDIQNLAPRIRAEVIWILGGKDTVVGSVAKFSDKSILV